MAKCYKVVVSRVVREFAIVILPAGSAKEAGELAGKILAEDERLDGIDETIAGASLWSDWHVGERTEGALVDSVSVWKAPTGRKGTK